MKIAMGLLTGETVRTSLVKFEDWPDDRSFESSVELVAGPEDRYHARLMPSSLEMICLAGQTPEAPDSSLRRRRCFGYLISIGVLRVRVKWHCCRVFGGYVSFDL